MFRRRKKRLAARRAFAPDQTKDLGGSGNASGVMPAPPRTAMSSLERRTVVWRSFTDVFPPRFPGNLVGREMEIDASGAVEIDIVLEDVAP